MPSTPIKQLCSQALPFIKATFLTLALLSSAYVIAEQATNDLANEIPEGFDIEQAVLQIPLDPNSQEAIDAKEEKAEKKQQKLIDNAVEQFKGVDEQGNEIVCSKDEAIAVEADGKVSYRCQDKSKALGVDNTAERGESETNALIDDLLEESQQDADKKIELNESEIQRVQKLKDSEEKEQESSETHRDISTDKDQTTEQTKNQKTENIAPDEAASEKSSSAKIIIKDSPQSQQVSDKNSVIIDDGNTEKTETDSAKKETGATEFTLSDSEEDSEGFERQLRFIEKIPVKAYLSFRLTASKEGNNNATFSDGDSRGGLIYAKKLANEDQIILHAEAGFNYLQDVNPFISQDSETKTVDDSRKIRQRLSYFRYGRDDYYAVFGKNWSIYHYIAGMTDKFLVVGGKAMGVYNAGTDGGAAGTGRASRALQLRSSRGQFQWGVQLQANNDIPNFSNANYDLNAAVMGKLKTLHGIGIGFSYNRAVPENYTDEMLLSGFDAASSAWVLGIEYQWRNWYFSSTYSENENQVTDNTLHYYDARGWEVFTSNNIDARNTLRVGWNMQEPTDTKHYQAKHQIEEYYLSYSYNYNNKNTEDKLYSEYIFNQGRLADGSKPSNAIVVGFRYNFQN
jgi:hypothetical protein